MGWGGIIYASQGSLEEEHNKSKINEKPSTKSLQLFRACKHFWNSDMTWQPQNGCHCTMVKMLPKKPFKTKICTANQLSNVQNEALPLFKNHLADTKKVVGRCYGAPCIGESLPYITTAIFVILSFFSKSETMEHKAGQDLEYYRVCCYLWESRL